MIKNIVFDMGNVMVEYDANRVCSYYMEEGDAKEWVCTAVFHSAEWILLDMGLISEEEALKRMQSRLRTSYEKEMAERCFQHWHEYNMTPKKGMGELVKELKEKGYRIYLLSNASLRLLQCCNQVIPGIEYFDGVMFSAEEKLLKPQKEIYQRLFEKFSLQPEECFFIDDMEDNIEGGRACGMDGYCFTDGDVEKLRERLWEL